MKKILLLATGGTIASVPSADGLVPGLEGRYLVEMVPEIAGMCELECQEILNLDSSNIEPVHWQKIVKSIADNYSAFDGFIITHGTDTMAYTCAALSMMLDNVSKPIAVTGAQLSMIEDGTDAKRNLLHAVQAAVSDLKGVALVFGDVIIHGCYAKKLCTQNFNGFKSINYPYLAKFDEEGIIWNTENHCGGACGKGKLQVADKLEPKVCVIKITPGLKPDILFWLAENGYKGVILEGFGNGGVPNDSINWLPALGEIIKKGIRVVCTSQCIYDGVNLERYPIGSLAQKLGAESGGKLTVEALLVKLMVELA